MAVSTTTYQSQYVSNGSSTVYSTGFPVIQYTDVEVFDTNTTTNTVTQLTYGTQYTVSGALDSGGAVTVTLGSAIASGDIVTIQRVEPITQLNNLVDNAAWSAETITAMFDKLCMVDQQLNGSLSKAIQFPATDSSSLNNILPLAAVRAGKTLGFDPSGNITTVSELGTWRGNWAASTLYNWGDIWTDPSTSNLYYTVAQPSYTSGTAVAVDVSAGSVVLLLNVSSVTANVGSANASAIAAAASAATASSNAGSASVYAVNAGSSATTAASNAGSASTSAVNAGSSATTASANAGSAAASAALAASYTPSQTGNSGKFLTTNGTATSWGNEIPSQTGNSGKYLSTNGTSTVWNSVATGSYVVSKHKQIFSNSGTYTPSAGLIFADITVVGGGGGGQTVTSGASGGSGAGGGCAMSKGVLAATIGTSVIVTVGSGGAAGSNGGTSSFGTIVKAAGGGGCTAAPPPAGGTGVTGDVLIQGGPGLPPWGSVVGVTAASQPGANSYFGGGGQSTASGAGGNGGNYGGGGAGGYSTGGTGGSGGAGVVIVEEYCSQ